MRSHKLGAVAVGVMVLASAPSSLAQTFPADGSWLPITRGGVVLGDPAGDAQNERDIVGDEANPAAFVFGDASFLYFRLRIADTPLQANNEYKPFGWGVELDTNGDLNNYEFLSMLDGINNPDVVTLWQNTTQATAGSPKDVADTLLASWPTTTHARAVQAGTTLGGAADWFVDWAVDRTNLVNAGVDFSKPISFVFGSSNNAQTLAADLLSPSSATTIPELASDPVNCNGTSCTSCATAGACGPSCQPCGGSTPYCNGSACVECTSSSQCPTARPLCQQSTGTCVAGCSTDADCKDPALPACQPSGQCGQCSATNSSRCTGATPTCDIAAGVCIGTCTVDADCKEPAAPACQPDGRCSECSASNKTRCTANETCDTQTGLCSGLCTTDADCKDPTLPACQPDGVCGQCSVKNTTACQAPLDVCEVLTGRCAAGCTSDAQCKNPALPVCRADGVCVQCSASNTTLCKAPTPVCDAIQGQCVARCTTDGDCKDPSRPACSAAGVCSECSASNHSLCVGSHPTCFVLAGVCVPQCTSDAQCTNPLWPACGPEGFCWQCSSSNVSRCNEAAPACDTSVGLCVAAPPVPEGLATFDGSGLACATSQSERAAGLSMLLLSGGALARLRRRRQRR